jgi:hypothetical protein
LRERGDERYSLSSVQKLRTPSPGWGEGIKLGVLKWCSLWLCCPPSYCCSPFRVRNLSMTSFCALIKQSNNR